MLKRVMAFTAVIVLGLQTAFAATTDQGTKEEAVAMAELAHQMYQDQGMDAMVAAIGDAANTDFHDRDLYVFVYDNAGDNIGHGANPKLVGKNLLKVKDQNGVFIIQEMIEVSNATGTGWVDYHWVHPETKKITAKASYVIRLDDNHFLGVGVYTE